MPFRIQPYYPIPNLDIYKQNPRKNHIKIIVKSLSSRYCENPFNYLYVPVTVLYT